MSAKLIDSPVPASIVGLRNQAEARRVIDRAYPFRCCVVCGLQVDTCLQVAHLNHQAPDNTPDNLARLCPTHHWMYDAGLYPIEAIPAPTSPLAGNTWRSGP